MNERVEDRVLAFMKRALETRPQPLVGGGMTTREALKIVEEVQQYRARAAAHARMHPERLSEGELDLLRMSGDDLLDDAPLTHGRLVKAIDEIRQRRAMDLMPDDVADARRLHAWCASTAAPVDLPFEIRRDIQRLLEKLFTPGDVG